MSIGICNICELNSLCLDKKEALFCCPNYDPKENSDLPITDNTIISASFEIWYDFIDEDGNESDDISVFDARMFKFQIKRKNDNEPIVAEQCFYYIKPKIIECETKWVDQTNGYTIITPFKHEFIYIDENNMLKIDYNINYDEDLKNEFGIIDPTDIKFRTWLNKVNESLNDMCKALEEEEFCYYISNDYAYPDIIRIFVDDER